MEQGDDGRPLRSEAGIGKSRSGRGRRRPGPSTWIETKPSGFRRGANAYLLLTPDRAERVPPVPISVGRRDVQSINQADWRTGTSSDGRRRSSPVQSEADLLLCRRDSELNPCVPQGVRPAQDGRASDRADTLGEPDAPTTQYPLGRAPSAPTRKRAVSPTVNSSAARSAIRGWPSTRSTRRQ
jgi:hypothetical protein